ncbi:hypothetical protein [Qipengyuania sp. MTN3-11]|uniref:hypothetical protein n=1 Tax=Qipengyuania sp. MTN3-11 TaxID=3056557 RepID=UPI0036F197AC
MRFIWLFAGLLLLAPAAIAAEDALSITRSLYIARAHPDGIALEPAETLRPGDKVVLVMAWQESPGEPFTLVSEIPRTLAYQRSGDGAVEVSVDGGRRWGRIGSLRRGNRLAAPEEVTNLRWRIAAAESATMRSYSAIVR